MTALDTYRQRLGSRSEPSRERWLNNTQSWISRKLPNSLSYHTVIIDDEERNCAVLSTQNNNEKKICTMPGEYIVAGSYVKYMGFTWVVTEVNAPNEVYQTGLMTQCNYELKWVNDSGEIVSRWVSIVDGTKYLTGEFYQRNGYGNMTVGDSRMQLTMPRDSETVKINRGARFLVDDPECTQPQAYELTKINRTGRVFDGHGVFVHMLSECNRNDELDNYDLMIADYYKWFPREVDANTPSDEPSIVFGNDDTSITIGTSLSVPVMVCINNVDVLATDLTVSSNVDSIIATVSFNNGLMTIISNSNRKNLGSIFTVTVSSAEYDVSAERQYKIRGWV